MVLGTTSDAGKSFLSTALARILARKGFRVQPFKAQNMSLNSIPADDGGEIAVAQWLQCRAAGVPATTLSNPVLLKYEGDGKLEIIVRGRARLRVRDWHREMPRALPILRAELERAFEELRSKGALILAEGSGSPVELNLRSTDLSNFHVAQTFQLPVLLVASLDRGGALAQVVGTLQLLSPTERRLVRGVVLNEMRGDPRILQPALTFLERRTGIPVVGVIPHLEDRDFRWPAEDALSLARASFSPAGRRGARRGVPSPRVPTLGVLRLPHISNFLDFTPLQHAEGLDVSWVESPRDFSRLDALLIPGTRRTVDDLQWMEDRGLSDALHRGVAQGLRVGGICGGYHLLGRTLVDPKGFEGTPGTARGLGLLPISTRYEDPKIIREVRVIPWPRNPVVRTSSPLMGYEIHRGRTTRTVGARPFCRITPSPDPKETVASALSEEEGAVARGGQIWGTAVHGWLGSPLAVCGLRDWARGERTETSRERDACQEGDWVERSIDLAARHVELHLDMAQILSWMDPTVGARPAPSP